MNTPTSFYWHDYETWGATPRLDRAAQFAGIRTDLDFNIIGRPLMVYARPADDFLPHPEACFVTGLTPQECRDKGVPEAEFFMAIHEELARPGTCALGYNSLRFDDEVTRYGFYRNFIDPYAREWQNGNSRWDLIDVVRLTRALRPDGIEWPTREDGVTSFKLEHLSAANGIAHEGAHDALADVHATIALARLIKEKQPKLFDYAFNNRDKRALAKLLDVRARRPLLHVSGKYPAALGHIATVVPLAVHPTNKNEVVVYDLRVDPEPLLTLDADAVRAGEQRYGVAEQHAHMQVADDQAVKRVERLLPVAETDQPGRLAGVEQALGALFDRTPSAFDQQVAKLRVLAPRLADRQPVQRQRRWT